MRTVTGTADFRTVTGTADLRTVTGTADFRKPFTFVIQIRSVVIESGFFNQNVHTRFDEFFEGQLSANMNFPGSTLVIFFHNFIQRFYFSKFTEITIFIYQGIIIKCIKRGFTKVHHSSFTDMITVFFKICVFSILFTLTLQPLVKSFEVFHDYSSLNVIDTVKILIFLLSGISTLFHPTGRTFGSSGFPSPPGFFGIYAFSHHNQLSGSVKLSRFKVGNFIW